MRREQRNDCRVWQCSKSTGDLDRGGFSGIIRLETSMNWVKRKREIGIGDSDNPFQMFLCDRSREIGQ